MPRSSAPFLRRPAALAHALALAAALAAGVPAASADPESEQAGAAEGPRLRALHFEGAEAASRGRLEPLLATPIPPPWWQPWVSHPVFVEGTEEPDAERIAQHYRTLGYFETTVRPELRWSGDRREVEVVFHVDEGEPVRLVERGIEIPPGIVAEASAAAEPDEPGDLTEGLPLVVGEVFSLDRYEDAKRELLARLAEIGRPLASVEGGADVDVRTHEARLTWRVVPGPLVRFGPVRVEGLTRTDESLVRREITIAEGDVYSLSALRETRTSIQALRIFGSVIARPLPEEERPGGAGEVIWPMQVAVAERPPRSVRLGLGWGTDHHLRAQAGYEQRNWLGGARRLNTSVLYSSLERTLEASVTQPHFLARSQSLRAETRLGQELTPAYDAERLRGGVSLARDFDERWSGSLGWVYSWSAAGDVGGTANRLLDDPERRVFLHGPRFTVRRSTVANPLDARDGSRVDLSVTPWLPGLGSEVGFASIDATAAAFEPVGPTVVAGRLRLGTLQPYAGYSADEAPLPERFYTGGGSSVRGFSYWRLGPRRADGRAVGGASVLETSLELRFPIRGPLGGVTFVDAGQVDLDPWGWKLRDLTYSVGAGLRYDTPLGPIRLDLAYPLNAPEEAGTTWFHFSIGQAF
jgi:outer membrane protein assembly complex protein YaeT